MTKKTLYAILGTPETARIEEIRQAYEQRMAGLDPSDTILQTAIKDAWDILSNPQRRERYDASLRRARAQDEVAIEYVEVSGSGKMPYVIGALVLLIAAGWYFFHKPAKPAPQMTTPAVLAQDNGTQPETTTPNTPAALPGSAKGLTPEELFSRASNSIARINVFNGSGQQLSIGSGVVIDNGTVITNCHVTRGGAAIKVKMQNAQYDASIQVADEQHDLCKLSVPQLRAPSVSIGRVSSLKVGQKVFAIGSPHGLDLTISDGLISSLRDASDGTYIQTTAPVSPGSSGGGLFDETGQLVGIVTFQDRSGQNLNFAIPADWILSMSASSGHDSSRYSATRPEADSSNASDNLIVGDWHCFGPLTGRGLDMTFAGNGVVSGSMDGKPFMGRYYMQGKQITLFSDVFQIEELSTTRLVMSQGSGHRLVCNH